MAAFDLISCPNDVVLAQTVAEEWLSKVEAANRLGTPHFVALSGGRIARRFYAAVAEFGMARKIDFARVHFFWGDERCVPPTDAASNFALANQLLLQPLKIASENIHRIRGELEPPRAATAAAEDLCRVVAANRDQAPRLDLIILGMGEDGHVASLFPGESEAVMSDPAIFRAVQATKPPPSRITIGYGVIAAAWHVWVLASGAGKALALHESLSASEKTPLSRVLKERPNTKVFTDIAGG